MHEPMLSAPVQYLCIAIHGGTYVGQKRSTPLLSTLVQPCSTPQQVVCLHHEQAMLSARTALADAIVAAPHSDTWHTAVHLA